MKKLVVLAAAVVSLIASQSAIAGANSDKNLKDAVAQQVMEDTHKDISVDNITLHDIHRGMFGVKWRATTPNGEYACRADDMLRNVHCTHLEKS